MNRFLILTSFVTLAACGSKSPRANTTTPAPDDDRVAEREPDPARTEADLLAAEQTAYEGARPVFETYCSKCHSDSGSDAKPKTLAHFDMTSYPFGGHHVATMGPTIQHVLGIDGSEPSMPRDEKGAVKGDELDLVRAWTEAWLAADEGGAHPEVADDHDED